MTRTPDVRALVEAFTLPGSNAESAYRAALEGREPLRTTPDVLDAFARTLVEGLGWEPDLADVATDQVARLAGISYPPA
jgi:hypothetical protein